MGVGRKLGFKVCPSVWMRVVMGAGGVRGHSVPGEPESDPGAALLQESPRPTLREAATPAGMLTPHSISWSCFGVVYVAKRKGRITRLGHFRFLGGVKKLRDFCLVTQPEMSLKTGLGGGHCLPDAPI